MLKNLEEWNLSVKNDGFKQLFEKNSYWNMDYVRYKLR